MDGLNPFMNQVYLYAKKAVKDTRWQKDGLNPFMNQVYLYWQKAARQRASEYAAS